VKAALGRQIERPIAELPFFSNFERVPSDLPHFENFELSAGSRGPGALRAAAWPSPPHGPLFFCVAWGERHAKKRLRSIFTWSRKTNGISHLSHFCAEPAPSKMYPANPDADSTELRSWVIRSTTIRMPDKEAHSARLLRTAIDSGAPPAPGINLGGDRTDGPQANSRCRRRARRQ